jgi:hypothetical protein
MKRFIVELSNGERWELSASSRHHAAARALYWGSQYTTVTEVWTVAEYRQHEAERIADEYAAVGIVVTDRGVTL